MSLVPRSVLTSKYCLESVFGVRGCDSIRAFSKKLNDGNVEESKSSSDASSGYGSLNRSPDLEFLYAKRYREMPCVKMIPFLGSSWAYLPLIGKYSKSRLHLADIHKNQVYGDVVRERFGKFEIVSSYHPDTMRILSENEGTYPSRSDFSCLKVYRQKRKEWFESDGFLVAQGKEWLDMRESLTRYLEQPYLKNYLNPLNEIGDDFVHLISLKRDDKKEVDDVVVHLRKWALECVTRITLNTRLGVLAPNLDDRSDSMKILNAVQTQLDCMYKLEASSANVALWKYIPTPTWRKFKKAADVFTALSYKYIGRAVHASKSDVGEINSESPTFLQYVLLAQGASISSAVVTVADIILTGLDTTSHTAAFLLYNLAKNPDKQELAYKEVLGLLPKEGDKMTPDIYEQLGYLKACLKESMRLTPTVRGNVRVLNHDVVVNGYQVPAGTPIICVLQVIHRNEKYFKNANRFLPERWNSGDAMKLNQFAYQPFGYGKRSCLGKNLAEMEIVTLAAKILLKYAVEYHYDDLDMYTRLINVPDRPLRLKFVDRRVTPRR